MSIQSYAGRNGCHGECSNEGETESTKRDQSIDHRHAICIPPLRVGISAHNHAQEQQIIIANLQSERDTMDMLQQGYAQRIEAFKLDLRSGIDACGTDARAGTKK